LRELPDVANSLLERVVQLIESRLGLQENGSGIRVEVVQGGARLIDPLRSEVTSISMAILEGIEF